MENGFSWQVGSIYLFNAMFGIGFLTLPKPFSQVGLIAGIYALAAIALTSYATMTFVLEVLSIYNACFYTQRMQEKEDDSIKIRSVPTVEDDNNKYEPTGTDNNSGCEATEDEEETLLKQKESNKPNLKEDIFEVVEEAAVGDLCKMFFNKIGFILTYLILLLFVYGSIAVKITVVAVSLTTFICGDDIDLNRNSTASCTNVKSYTAMQMYLISVTAFVTFWAPFVFLNISKTKIIQIVTMMIRFFSFASMIVLAFLKIYNSDEVSKPKLVDMSEIPNFISIALYTFSVHFTYPHIITPITNKNRLKIATVLPFIFSIAIAVLLVVPVTYAFPEHEIQDLITLNFTSPVFLKYLLQLFPVFTIAAAAPTSGVALREQLKTLFLSKTGEECNVYAVRILFPLCVIIPPTIISLSTTNIDQLVSYIAGFLGGISLYIIPTLLVFYARRKATKTFGKYENSYQSPLQHNFWLVLILLWYLTTLVSNMYFKIIA